MGVSFRVETFVACVSADGDGCEGLESSMWGDGESSGANVTETAVEVAVAECDGGVESIEFYLAASGEDVIGLAWEWRSVAGGSSFFHCDISG